MVEQDREIDHMREWILQANCSNRIRRRYLLGTGSTRLRHSQIYTISCPVWLFPTLSHTGGGVFFIFSRCCLKHACMYKFPEGASYTTNKGAVAERYRLLLQPSIV